jgi:hypothetical protein
MGKTMAEFYSTKPWPNFTEEDAKRNAAIKKRWNG